MGRGPKPTKSKAAKLPAARKSRKSEGSTVQDLEKRLAKSLAREEVTGKLLEEKTRALTGAHAQVSEALEQRTATAELLSVISGSPTAPEVQGKVFEEFRQVATADKKAEGPGAGPDALPQVHRTAQREDLRQESGGRGLGIHVHDPRAWRRIS